MEDLPAKGLGTSFFPRTVQAQQLEPPNEVSGEGNGHEPVGVRLDAGEEEPAESGPFESLDVTLDGITAAVGVETPVAFILPSFIDIVIETSIPCIGGQV